jgi:excisionase family DNA binding protein
MKLEDNAFNDLPLLLAVPRAAQLLGISRAAAYRLAASGELPVRRLGGRVYIVTAGFGSWHHERLCAPAGSQVVAT